MSMIKESMSLRREYCACVCVPRVGKMKTIYKIKLTHRFFSRSGFIHITAKKACDTSLSLVFRSRSEKCLSKSGAGGLKRRAKKKRNPRVR